MSILVEGISVIIRCDALSQAFPGGLAQFGEIVPNNTYCADGEVARVGFATDPEALAFMTVLESRGIPATQDGQPVAAVMLDQAQGFALPCVWAEFGRIDLEGSTAKRVSFCRLAGSQLTELLTPDSWSYDNSASARFTATANGR
ncbi:MAG: hypothetical protein H7338_22860 [Candidatus Sericytochromatia bacterium]|nr:hypothetical protein [Candidatus Sericytochromatia bacterium]